MSRRITPRQSIVPLEVIERRIYLIRGDKVMLDSHLAELYQVPTFRLNEAVKRNHRRFPDDFMFRLTKEEAESLTSQTAMSNPGRGGRRTLPYVFTEQGVSMLSSVLNSERAIAVNIAIMRTFVRLRYLVATHKDLAAKLEAMGKKYDRQFKLVFEIIRQLTGPGPAPERGPMGFIAGSSGKSRAP
jgi:hypothetical protein